MAPDSRATFFRQAHNALHWMLRNSENVFLRLDLIQKLFFLLLNFDFIRS